MTQPLALVLYERLLPGSQLVNRLQDLKYRVQVVTKVEELVAAAEQAKPLLVLADLEPSPTPVLGALRALRQHSLTQHLPIIALAGERLDKLKAEAEAAGVTLLVGDTAILNHLPQLLDQALQIE